MDAARIRRRGILSVDLAKKSAMSRGPAWRAPLASPAQAVILAAMRATTRYLLRQIAGPLVFVTMTLAGVIWLTQALRFIDRIVNQGLPFGSFLALTGLLLPGVVQIILPIALFCAMLYAYNRLAGDSELVVLYGAGFSRFSLARPALMVGLIVMALMSALQFYLMPLSARTLRTMQYEFRTNLAAVLLQEGVFNTPLAGLTVYVRERQPNGVMAGILVHDNRDPQRPITMMAERGALIRSDAGPLFVMESGNRQQVEDDRQQLSLLYFDSYTLDLGLYAKPTGEGWREPHERYMHELFWPDLNDIDDQNNRWQLLVEGHRRLANLLFVPALALIALASVLAGEFNRRGRGERLIAAAVAAIWLQVMGLASIHLATKTPVLLPLIYANPIVFAVAALYVLAHRARRRPAAAWSRVP
jgi:lipopolysaccharide export system permease protein